MAHLNVHQLEVFVAVAQRGNITHAANELLISQPAVSEQIKELERACGLPLLERQSRGVRLTQAGEVVYAYAQRLFAAAEELEQSLADLRQGTRGRLRLGASMTIGQYLLPKVMGAFQERYPGVALSLVVGNSREIVDGVLGRELGLGFVGGTPSHPALAVMPYVVDEIVAIVSPRHKLAAHPTVSLADLRQANWIAREPGSATRSEAEGCLEAAGVELEAAMELGSNEAVKSAVAAGLGFALISRLDISAEAAAGQLVVRTVADWNCRRLFCICHLRNRRLSRVERAFLHFIDREPGAPAALPGDERRAPPDEDRRVVAGEGFWRKRSLGSGTLP